MRVVGAGLGRTGTASLKGALETLLGGPCYHMIEVFERPQDIPVWHQAALGNMPDWPSFLSEYQASVDWPSSAFWQEQSEAFPEAMILLSLRDPEQWWESASQTIFAKRDSLPPGGMAWVEMIQAVFASRFGAVPGDRQACIDAFNRHNDEVLRTAPKDRLVVWQAKDGWEPIFNGLGLPVPAEPFPRTNTREEFIARANH
ncbi:sulfotransferase family protein [soil metagenome]